MMYILSYPAYSLIYDYTASIVLGRPVVAVRLHYTETLDSFTLPQHCTVELNAYGLIHV